MGQKRGQITIFIIVGVILLFSVALIIYIRSRAVEEIPSAQVPVAIAEVPAELQPINNYVLGCLRQTSTDALTAIGAHGGYLGVTTDDSIEYGLPTFSFTSAAAGMTPTGDDGISVSPDWQVPYWFYMKSQNTCQAGCEFGNLAPSLEGDESSSIKNQVQQYVNKNVVTCLNNFPQFRRQGYTITPTADPISAAVFAEKDVAVYLEYPLRIVKEGAESDLKQFLVRLDVPFKRIYELASDVAQVEAEQRFLDVHALTLIAIYGGMDKERLPPMAGTDLSYVPIFWFKSEVQEKLQNILTAQTSSLRVANTRNFVEFRDFGDDLLKTTLYRKKAVPFAKTYPDLDVEFNYLGWPIYLYIMPGELIRARESFLGKVFIALIPLQRYDLPYDVSYPSLVQVHDDYAFAGKGYDFFFGLEANVRNNVVLDETSAGVASQLAGGADSGQLCDPRQRNSGDYTVRVQDHQGRPVDGAVVSFASSVQFCPIGRSELNAQGTIATFAGKFPTGAIGALLVEKAGYTTHVKNYFNPKTENTELDPIVLKPVINKSVLARKVNVDFLTVDYVDTPAGSIPVKGWVLRPSDQPLQANEKLTVIMERQKENPFESAFVAFVEVKGSDMTKKISLIPGTYKMTVILVREGEDVIIPEDYRCEGGVLGFGEECFTLPEVHLDSGGGMSDAGVPTTSREEAFGNVDEAMAQGESLPPELETDYATARELPPPPEGMPDLGAAATPEKVFLEGQYVLENVIIGNEIYTTNSPLKLTGISWNLVALPEGERKHEHTETLGKLQEMVDANQALFLPRYGASGGAVG
ncbi:hypothetical protein HY488_00745 [Candidatus Woesearchaeota archaeon]|nr:hypothetical protein [Candidatus Woesearchaeota archaeon]